MVLEPSVASDRLPPALSSSLSPLFEKPNWSHLFGSVPTREPAHLFIGLGIFP